MPICPISNYVAVSLLVLASAVSKAVQDATSFHFDSSVFKGLPKWFDPASSWNNKWTWSSNPIITFLLANPLVFITDAWHFFGAVGRVSLFACLFFSIPWWSVPLFYLEFALVFHLFFSYVFVRK